jgi:hypothetical protein
VSTKALHFATRNQLRRNKKLTLPTPLSSALDSRIRAAATVMICDSILANGTFVIFAVRVARSSAAVMGVTTIYAPTAP